MSTALKSVGNVFSRLVKESLRPWERDIDPQYEAVEVMYVELSERLEQRRRLRNELDDIEHDVVASRGRILELLEEEWRDSACPFTPDSME